MIKPPMNEATKNINCLIKKYVDGLLYLSTAATEDDENTIRRPILHNSMVAKNKGLSILENIFFIRSSYNNNTTKLHI